MNLEARSNSLKLKHINDRFVSYGHTVFASQDVNWWTGVVWVTYGLLLCFYQLFGLSFWRHPFTAEDPLMSKWCNATLLNLHWWRKTHLHFERPECKYISSTKANNLLVQSNKLHRASRPCCRWFTTKYPKPHPYLKEAFTCSNTKC